MDIVKIIFQSISNKLENMLLGVVFSIVFRE